MKQIKHVMDQNLIGSFQIENKTICGNQRSCFHVTLINPIAYGILLLSQLEGGGGELLSNTPENNVKIV